MAGRPADAPSYCAHLVRMESAWCTPVTSGSSHRLALAAHAACRPFTACGIWIDKLSWGHWTSQGILSLTLRMAVSRPYQPPTFLGCSSRRKPWHDVGVTANSSVPWAGLPLTRLHPHHVAAGE